MRTTSSPRRLAVGAIAVAAVVSAATMAITAGPSGAASGCGAGYVALTFDDGPNAATTSTLLSVLQGQGVRATLFNIGQNVAANPSLVKAEAAANMWIGNHSYTHSHMTTLTSAQMTSELQRTNDAITAAGAPKPSIFRPPYGETNSTLQAAASGQGLTTVTWDVDSQDWNGASTSAIVSAAGRLTNGQIILMHDGYQTTRDAIPQIVAGLNSRSLCAGMISPTTGRAVAPTGSTTTTSPVTTPPVTTASTTSPSGTSSGCSATYAVTQSWTGGFVSTVTVKNTGTATTTGWKVGWTFAAAEKIASFWNATITQSGTAVTATNVSYNGALAAGATTSFGFQGTTTGTTSVPSSVSCTAS